VVGGAHLGPVGVTPIKFRVDQRRYVDPIDQEVVDLALVCQRRPPGRSHVHSIFTKLDFRQTPAIAEGYWPCSRSCAHRTGPEAVDVRCGTIGAGGR
jgi:hypothetical protein